MDTIKWYHYIAAFFAGFLLANAIPHLVHGMSGDPFPTPFANPPGKGLSSPLVNGLWAYFNLILGYVLFRAGKISAQRTGLLIVFFVAVLITIVMLSMTFADKMKM